MQRPITELQPENVSKRVKLSQPVSELKAGGMLPDTGTAGVASGDDSESAADSATLQQEDVPSKAASVTTQLTVADTDGHGHHVEKEEREREDSSTTTGSSNHHHKAKLKKKKKRKKEDLDEVPADPTSTSVTPDHLR